MSESGFEIDSAEQLRNAVEAVELACGHPPTRFVVAQGAAALSDLRVGEVLVFEALWRRVVEEQLAQILNGFGGLVDEWVIDVYARRDGWTCYGVPVDTSRLQA